MVERIVLVTPEVGLAFVSTAALLLKGRFTVAPEGSMCLVFLLLYFLFHSIVHPPVYVHIPLLGCQLLFVCYLCLYHLRSDCWDQFRNQISTQLNKDRDAQGLPFSPTLSLAPSVSPSLSSSTDLSLSLSLSVCPSLSLVQVCTSSTCCLVGFCELRENIAIKTGKSHFKCSFLFQYVSHCREFLCFCEGAAK